MKTTTFLNYRITAKYLGNKCWDSRADTKMDNYNNHRVTVTNLDTLDRCQFEFWASIMNPELRTRSDLLSAFECFLSDAIGGSGTFEEFCSEFGYDTDSRKAEKVYKACVRARAKADRLTRCGNLHELSNQLREMETAEDVTA